ncbi:MAG: hypothetical protein IIB77_09400, partial [Proteobacteria bacterium]|nr:hypothetical protein [Pseudomonadota bacterium]
MSEETPQVVLDRSLASRVAAGDQDAFDAFFREYFPRLFRFILSRIDNDADLAEEIVQRTMCIVVRKMGSYRGEALLFTWLCQICRNEASAVFRQRKLEVKADIPIEDHPAVQAALCHFNVMVKKTSRVFVAGPPVVKAALGIEIHKDDLGNEAVQVRQSGVIANLAENEEDAIDQIKRFLSYLPQNVWEAPPRAEPADDPNRREESLLEIVPSDRRTIYDPYAVLKAVLDLDSFFEIQPLFGEARVTGLARVDGYPVGVMINNPHRNGGALDKDAGEKTSRLMQLCDTFHLPL